MLNIAHEDAWQFLFDRIDALVSEYGIDYIKWDHNRELHEASRRDAGGRAGVRAQTEALYRLLDALRTRHRGLEIESCASGGGRIDLGILQHTDRVWASDCNDPVERQRIQRWTGQLLPPELMGTHVGAAEAHTTRRVTSLSFRLATALFGHAGIEQNLNACERRRAGHDPRLGRALQGAATAPAQRAGRPGRRRGRADPAARRRRRRPDGRGLHLGAARHVAGDPARAASRCPASTRTAATGSGCAPRSAAPVLHEHPPGWLTAAEDGARDASAATSCPSSACPCRPSSPSRRCSCSSTPPDRPTPVHRKPAHMLLDGTDQLGHDETTPRRFNRHRSGTRAPATRWFEALPIGNGRLGGMVYGGSRRRPHPAVGVHRLVRRTVRHRRQPDSGREQLAHIRALLFAGEHAQGASGWPRNTCWAARRPSAPTCRSRRC